MDENSSKEQKRSNGRSVIVSVRMSAEERRLLLEDADRIGCSASEFLRRLAGQAAGLCPVLTASDRHVLSNVLSSLQQFAQRLEALERAIRQEGSTMPDDVTDVLREAAEAVRALAGLYVVLARRGQAHLMGAIA